MSCSFHAWHLVTRPTRPRPRTRMRLRLDKMHPKPTMRVWVCRDCGAQTEAPVSRRHEIQWSSLAKPGPLETQLTIHDVLGEGPELFRVAP